MAIFTVVSRATTQFTTVLRFAEESALTFAPAHQLPYAQATFGKHTSSKFHVR
jgi:hypothetical protein